ncbi:protein FMC1 homolog isoform X2 [Coccinella septempunctata]|uniref:protein FMC1 homolog isoform X2 n=1 Tax=Coccinella septempunctata TaxID=41139 RepID=UPI001D096D00|nr:protein FMC1 homolog isoform X2 [Coccinella septempunctata]XP_044755951.1 protein FMC1 homolog isoform X2 [Coccinella septempunctata]
MAGVSTIRNIISELRHAIPKENLKNHITLRYIVGEFRKYQTTDEQLCKAKEEMKFMAETYLCYLKSSRLCQQIHHDFHGKGERTIEETAKMVGFKLPHDPK